MLDINDAQFQELKQKEGLQLVDIWAPWCGPCKKLIPILEELASEVTDVKFLKLNADENRKTCSELNVRGIPTMVLLKDGKVVDTLVGSHAKERVIEFIKKNR